MEHAFNKGAPHVCVELSWSLLDQEETQETHLGIVLDEGRIRIFDNAGWSTLAQEDAPDGFNTMQWLQESMTAAVPMAAASVATTSADCSDVSAAAANSSDVALAAPAAASCASNSVLMAAATCSDMAAAATAATFCADCSGSLCAAEANPRNLAVAAAAASFCAGCSGSTPDVAGEADSRELLP